MVTSTSTPGSREMEVICLTTSAEEVRSINRLWILISYRSQVLDPSPHGLSKYQLLSPALPSRLVTHVFRVVCFKNLVGSRTGPLTFRFRSLARLTRSPQTTSGISIVPVLDTLQHNTDSHFSRGLTFLEVKVILILWVLAAPAPAVLSRSFS